MPKTVKKKIAKLPEYFSSGKYRYYSTTDFATTEETIEYFMIIIIFFT